MVVCGEKYYDSFEELGYAIVRSLPKKRQPVKWWRGWSTTRWCYQNCMARTPWQKVKVWLPHFHKSRSHVGYFWIHSYLFNRWDVMFACGYYKFKEKDNAC